MSVPGYQSYRLSGLDWPIEIPEHWQVKPLKYVASLKGRLGWQGLRSDEYTEDGPYLVTSEHFSNDRVDWERCHHVSLDRYNLAPEIQLRPHDLLVMKDGAAMGKLAYVDSLPGPACLNSHLLLFRPRGESFLNRFLYYVLSSPSFKTYIVQERTGTTFFGISQQSIGAFPFVMPPLSEQASIVNFLDRETAKIDSLVDEQKRLIELLKEKRQAVLTQAVIKGIDPNAPMKDSGVEWLGDIPEHWKVLRTKAVYRERDERSADGSEELLSVSHLTGVTPRSEKTVNMFEAETTEGYKKVYKTDFVVNTLWAWMGAMGSSSYDGIASPAYHVYALRGDLFSSDYMDLMCRIGSFVRFVGSRSSGVWSSRLRFYPTDFFEVMIPVPPISEQVSINQYVEKATGPFRDITAKAEQAIALLQEHRAALVSAAITGKIDVRALIEADGDVPDVAAA